MKLQKSIAAFVFMLLFMWMAPPASAVEQGSMDNATANFNMGLQKVEQKDYKSAEKYLCAAIKANPQMDKAAYNLGIILFKNRPDEALMWFRKACDIRPEYPKYFYTLAFYTRQKGDIEEAVCLLKDLIVQRPQYVDAYMLLGDTYEKQGRVKEAEAIYRQAIGEKKLPLPARSFFENKLRALPPVKKSGK